jgi:hypothetical protein
MVLQNNQIVQLRNGICGVVASFNNKPFQLIFRSYTNPISRYSDELKNKNSQYDIVKVFDGSSINDVTDVFKTKFNPDNLTLIWEGNNQ